MSQNDHMTGVRPPRQTLEKLPSVLTPREYEIAELIAQGLSNHQIAERLVVAPGTVANHVAHVLAKLDSDSRVQVAVKMALYQSRIQSEPVLALLERLRGIRHASVQQALQHATDVLASTFAADKVDAFLVDVPRDLLVAVGTSQTPMGRRQHELGLHRLALSNGGRAAWVLQEWRPFLSGQLESDELELPGVRYDLGVRSLMAVPLEVNAGVRGVLVASSASPERFSDAQLQLLQFVSYWVGVVAREQSAGVDGEQAR